MALNTPIGLTPDSFQRMITGAGAGYLNLDLQGGETAEVVSEKIQAALEAGDCIGATRGGFSFDFGYDTRDIEVDGKFFPFKGSTQLTVMNASVETTLLEITPGNLARVFGNSEYDDTAKRMRFRMQFTNDSYIDEIWFVFALIGGGYVAIKLQNVLNTAGSSPTTSSEGEMELPVTLVGHQGSLTDSQYGPAEIYWFDETTDNSGGGTGNGDNTEPEA